MNKIKLKTSFEDSRGKIVDMLDNEKINAVTFISFNKGAVRGNHYHKRTIQWNYMLGGKLLVRTKKEGRKCVDYIAKKGDFFVSPRNEVHAFKALEDSAYLVFTKGPRQGKNYESDTYRCKVPILQPTLRCK
jgi:quercetin dioxygenase-like cupin family protein